MKSYQIYFSPTGGTRKVADILAGASGRPYEPIDLLRSPTATEALSLTEDDLCLFAFPSFGGRLPSVTRPLLERLKGNGARAVLVIVYGNRAIDDTLVELQDLLSAAGFRCVAGIEAVAEHSLCRSYGAGRPDETDADELKGFAGKIEEALSRGWTKGPLSLPGHHPYRSFGGVPFKPVASTACIGCGRCAAECPVGAIPRERPETTDGSRCISCMHCVAICPVQARALPASTAVVAKAALAVKCSGRKTNKLYL